MKSPMGRAAALVVTLCAAVVLTGCAAGRPAAAVPPRVPGQATAGPDLVGVRLPSFILPLVSGGVSRPNPKLTPGAVSETNTTVLCGLPKAATSVSVPLATGNALYAEYGYTTPEMQRKYTLDYLVPIDLGGATAKANIWPASMRGTGFYQKVQLDHVLRDLVCRRTLALATAQRALKADWYAAWLKYVVASGRS